MATPLQQLLRSLCCDTDWNYAVFWKLKHRARMVLTWEDAYYNNHFRKDHSESKIFNEAFEHLAHDPLGLAVAKMSYHVHSLGEGIVSQVAVTGKHQWIFAGEHAMHSGSLLESCDGWREQFLAGIKTIAVVAVVPHGVLELGSLNKVTEDPKVLTHIRALFSTLQEPVSSHIQNPLQSSFQNVVSTSDMSIRTSGQDILQEYLHDLDGSTNKDQTCDSSPVLPSPEKRKFNDLEAMENLDPSFMFSGGSELHEALGPAFLQQCYPSSWKVEKPEKNRSSRMREVIESSSLLTSDSGSDNLLEAVVANICFKDDTLMRRVKSFSTCDSMLTTEKMPEPSIVTRQTMASSSYSIGCSSLLEGSIQNSFNCSDSCSIRSSTSASRPSEPGKPNKKRARPGESSRPRPRDRQLIQDRIKELRDLVPNGAKCSIDSLLERTIKHMFFMQSVTKHADKLSKCAKQRGGSNETGVLIAGCDQGSSWAVEVGGHMKICPIIVENLNTNGQMLIEMLCEECEHFVEIAEAIRSLGLSIMKGITDDQEGKTWMRFIVEGKSHNNRNLHRMDVLCSLVQILQSKSAV